MGLKPSLDDDEKPFDHWLLASEKYWRFQIYNFNIPWVHNNSRLSFFEEQIHLTQDLNIDNVQVWKFYARCVEDVLGRLWSEGVVIAFVRFLGTSVSRSDFGELVVGEELRAQPHLLAHGYLLLKIAIYHLEKCQVLKLAKFWNFLCMPNLNFACRKHAVCIFEVRILLSIVMLCFRHGLSSFPSWNGFLRLLNITTATADLSSCPNWYTIYTTQKIMSNMEAPYQQSGVPS